MSPVDGVPVFGPPDLWGVHGIAGVVARAVEAGDSERVSVEMGLTPPLSDVLVAGIHLAGLRGQSAPVIVNGVDFLSGDRNTDVSSGRQPVDSADGLHVPGVSIGGSGRIGVGIAIVIPRGGGQCYRGEGNFEYSKIVGGGSGHAFCAGSGIGSTWRVWNVL